MRRYIFTGSILNIALAGKTIDMAQQLQPSIFLG